MLFYVKGFLLGLGGVAALYVTLRYFFQTWIGQVLYFAALHLMGHDFSRPLQATAGGNPSLFAHLWFWLWAMVVFAATFLVYLRLQHA
jgi:hypothetical protein